MKKKLLIPGVSLLSLIAASTALPPAAHGLPGSDPLRDQARADISRSLLENANAKTYAEWRQSGFTPEDLIENTIALHAPENLKALCNELASLDSVDLALFENAIEEHAEAIPCSTDLLNKLDMHWTFQSARINQRPLRPFTNEAEVNRFGTDIGGTPQLPSREEHVDVTKTHLMTSGGLKSGEIALTFDDGPHPSRSVRVMNILKEAGVRANFFEVGKNVQAFPSICKTLADQGEIVGSHSWDHSNLPKLPVDEGEQQITSSRDQVALATGMHIPFFRFPYGSYNSTLQNFVVNQGMTNFFWNMDSLDWKIRDPKQLYANVLKELNREKGGIILFHDIHEQTTIVLPLVLKELAARNFTTVVFVPH